MSQTTPLQTYMKLWCTNLDETGIACILGDWTNNMLSVLVTNRPYGEISTILNQKGIGRFVVISTPDLTISAQLCPDFTRKVKAWHSPYFITTGCVAEAIKIMTGSNMEPESIVQAQRNVYDAMLAMGVREGPTSLIPRLRKSWVNLVAISPSEQSSRRWMHDDGMIRLRTGEKIDKKCPYGSKSSPFRFLRNG